MESIADAVKRKNLPVWIRQGLEKMEREKQKKLEKEQREKEKQEAEMAREQAEKEAKEEIEKEKSKRENAGSIFPEETARRRSKFVSSDTRVTLGVKLVTHKICFNKPVMVYGGNATVECVLNCIFRPQMPSFGIFSKAHTHNTSKMCRHKHCTFTFPIKN